MGYLKTHAQRPGGTKRLSLLLFGRPKTGKTTLACSGEKPLLISYDPEGDSTVTLKDREDVWVIPGPPTQRDFNLLLADLEAKRDTYQWIVVDTVTSWAESWVNEQLYEHVENKVGNSLKIYGNLTTLITRNVAKLLGLGKHIVFTAQLRTLETKNSTDNTMIPDLNPRIQSYMGAQCSLIGRTYKNFRPVSNTELATDYWVSFNDEDSPAGGRLGDLGQRRDLNLDKLLTELGMK